MAAVNLFELFNGKIFRIPDYQRGYAWGDKQLGELWDDLDEIPEEGGEFKKHYTGTIYLEETQPAESEKWLSGVKFYDVVDGQQRLTTLSILLFELLKVAKQGYSGESKDDLTKTYISKTNSSGQSTVYKFSYVPTDKNFNFLLKNIFENKSIILQDRNINLYTKNLLKAKEYFDGKLKILSPAQLEIIFKKLTSSLQFDIRTIEKDLDVQAVFETMNNRGKPLSTLEKLKNRLIYLTEKLRESSEDKFKLRRSINDAWGKIYTSLAQNPELLLNEDVFLSAHLSLCRKPKEAVFSEGIAEEKVFQMFCNKSDTFEKDESGVKEDNVSYKKIEDYILKLSEAAPVWHQIHNSNSKTINKCLLLNSSKELKVFLLALLLKNNLTGTESTLNKIEQILFRNRVLWLFDERTLATWGRELYSEEEEMNEEQKKKELDEINKKIDALIQSPISTYTLIQSMNNLFTYVKGSKGFHRWVALKYFLFEYEEHLKHKFKETNDKVSLSDFENTTIEHIIPQQFSDNWSDVVNEFTMGLEDEQLTLAQKVLLNTLGNLTILKDGKNSSLGNSGWTEKKKRFSVGSYNEIEISHKTNWTKQEILQRGRDMLAFLETKVAGLTFNEDEKNKMLFYDDYVIDRILV